MSTFHARICWLQEYESFESEKQKKKMQGELAQVQWVSLHMQGESLPLRPCTPCPNPTLKGGLLLLRRLFQDIQINRSILTPRCPEPRARRSIWRTPLMMHEKVLLNCRTLHWRLNALHFTPCSALYPIPVKSMLALLYRYYNIRLFSLGK